jgi:hypothetical protein
MISKTKKRLTVWLVCIGLLGIYSCEKVLLNPLKGSAIAHKEYKNSVNFQGRIIYLTPIKTLDVRASSNGMILKVIHNTSFGYLIITQGKMNITYGNLAECFVKNDQTIKRGEIIGKLFSKDSVLDNSLEVSIDDNGKKVIPNW